MRPPDSDFEYTHVHGMRWSDVAEEPTFADHWPEITTHLEGVAFIAAHNAPFDQRVLHACCELAGVRTPRMPFLCTMKLARAAWGTKPTTLPDVCAALRIPLTHHDPLSDAEACARIVLAATKTERGRRAIRSLV